MQKIFPHLWFDKEAEEAVNFYLEVFDNSKINSVVTLKDTPSGDSKIFTFEIKGFKIMAINAGPYFKMNPSISLNVVFNLAKDKDAKEKLETAYKKLAKEGKVINQLDKYPFAELYAWVVDKYGFSWQLILVNYEMSRDINLYMMFSGRNYGKAEAAINYYLNVFKKSKAGEIYYYPEEEPKKVIYGDFELENQLIMVSDDNQDYNFNEAISLLVLCEDQAEIDYLWEKLSFDKTQEQCGWLKDKFGVSWQITPKVLRDMLENGTLEQIQRVFKKLMPMKKIIIQDLVDSFNE